MRICANNGGFLPEPRSEQENNFLREFTNLAFWLGAIRISGNEYIWLSDGTKVVYTNWLTGSHPTTNDCISSQYSLKAANWWSSPCTAHCDDLDCTIVCQRNVGKYSYYFYYIFVLIVKHFFLKEVVEKDFNTFS